MLIYRIEDNSHTGPYRSKLWDYSVHGSKEFPGNKNETLYEVLHNMFTEEEYKQFLCGFENEEQMLNWFSEDNIYKLLEIGFDIRVYECPVENVVIRDHQVFFNRNTARIVQ